MTGALACLAYPPPRPSPARGEGGCVRLPADTSLFVIAGLDPGIDGAGFSMDPRISAYARRFAPGITEVGLQAA